MANLGEAPTAEAAATTARARRGAYAKSAARRQEILTRALDVVEELGYENTSLRAIAERIGVTHPVLVHYFGSLETLFLEVLAEHDRRIVTELLPSSETVDEFITQGFEYSLRVPGLMALVDALVARAIGTNGGRSREYMIERYTSIRGILRDLLTAAQRSGEVRADIDPEDAAMVVLAVADGLSTQWMLDRRVELQRGIQLLEKLLAS
jgi:TetR/AcrR family transcriptional regulator, transcriptional repressor of aconitase